MTFPPPSNPLQLGQDKTMRKQLLTTTAAAAVAAGALTLVTPTPSDATAWLDNGSIGDLDGTATSLDVVSTGPGDAIAAWTESLPGDDRVFAARAVNGVWGAPVPLSPLGQEARDVHLAANGSGDAVLTWEHPGGGPGLRVLSGRRLSGGSWGAVTNLVPTPSDAALNHDVALADDGDAAVVFRVADGSNSTALVSDWPKAGAVLSSPIEPGQDDEFLPTLASNADGDLLVTFTRLGVVWSTYRAAGGAGWTDAKPTIGNTVNGISSTTLRPDGSGVVVAVQNGSEDAVRAVEIGPTGTPGDVSIVSDTSIPANNPSITSNADGDVLVTWATDGVEGYGVDYSVSTAGGEFSDPTVLRAPIVPTGLRPVAALTDNDLRVVLASEAQSLTVWHRTSGFQAQWQIHVAGPAPTQNPYAVDYDAEGNVVAVAAGPDFVHAEFLDAAGPVSRIVKPVRSIVTTDQLQVGWVATDSLSTVTGVTDVYATSAPWNAAGHTAPALIVDNADGSQVPYQATPGTTYCFQVRAQDTAGNFANSRQRCATVPLDDRKLAGQGWTRAEGAGHFLGTVTTTTKQGRTLIRKGVHAKRLALVVHKTQNSGTVKVTFAGKVLGTFSLQGKAKRRVVNLATFGSVRTGTVKVTVTSKGKPVIVDGLVVAK